VYIVIQDRHEFTGQRRWMGINGLTGKTGLRRIKSAGCSVQDQENSRDFAGPR
jgi:hypothetical protein